MTQRSLSDILADIDSTKVVVASDGKIAATDKKTADSLSELRELLKPVNMTNSGDPNGVQCHCGSTDPT